MGRPGLAEPRVQQRRRLVAEQQPPVHLVQQRVLHLPEEAGEVVLEVAVADVGDVEAGQPDDHEHDPLAGPVLAHEDRGLGAHVAPVAARPPQRARHDVEEEGAEHHRRQAHPCRAQEAVGVAQPLVEGVRDDQRHDTHEDRDAHEESVRRALHPCDSRERPHPRGQRNCREDRAVDVTVLTLGGVARRRRRSGCRRARAARRRRRAAAATRGRPRRARRPRRRSRAAAAARRRSAGR